MSLDGIELVSNLLGVYFWGSVEFFDFLKKWYFYFDGIDFTFMDEYNYPQKAIGKCG